MRIKAAKLFILGVGLSVLSACGSSGSLVNVILVEGEGYSCNKKVQSIPKGEDATFEIKLDEGHFVSSTSYPEYEVTTLEENSLITFKEVRYPVRITLSLTESYISYDANGGDPLKEEYKDLRVPVTGAHLKENALNGHDYFSKEGYLQIGWNSAADNSGKFVPFGGRIPNGINTLYAVYVQYSKETDFAYEKDGDGIRITGYLGNDQTIVVPNSINGMKTLAIFDNSFQGKTAETIVLPPNVLRVFPNSLPDVKYFVFFDNLESIYDNAFINYSSLRQVTINAVQKPAFSATYWDAFTDKMDYLESIKDEKKIILFSGSSGRYGYDSVRLMEEFPSYKVVNFGTFAYINMYPQMELIRQYMNEGDVLIHAPEFDALDCQFCVEKIIDSRFFNCIESDYGLIRKLDPQRFDTFLSRFTIFQETRKETQRKSYDMAAKWYDDDGNRYDYETYNIYGDMTLLRPNSPVDAWLYQPLCDYTGDAISAAQFSAVNSYYADLKEDGIIPYFTYAPKNNKCLTEDSTAEEIEKLDQSCKDNISIPVISDLQDYLYDGYYFYLIDNHLSDEGVDIRMEHFIEDLRPYLAEILSA